MLTARKPCKQNFTVHNYFAAKMMDQVRPGGVVAFVTSRYTMDSKAENTRKYLAERADLLGAIRLPRENVDHGVSVEATGDIIITRKVGQAQIVSSDGTIHVRQGIFGTDGKTSITAAGQVQAPVIEGRR